MPTANVQQMALFPASDLPEPETPNHCHISVSRVPSIQTILRHAWGAWHEIENKSDQEVLKAWQYVHVAEYLYQRSIDPRGYSHRAHHHILPQIANPDVIETVDQEFKRRGFDKKYTLWIEILSGENMIKQRKKTLDEGGDSHGEEG